MTEKRGRGRMPKPKNEKQSERVVTYLAPAEAKLLREDAARLDMTPSTFLASLWRDWRESKEKQA